MGSRRPKVLVVDTTRFAPLVAGLLGAEFEVFTADTCDAAERCLRERAPEAVVVGYHFDEMRAYRFVNHVRHDAAARGTPILVVRSAPLLFMDLDDEDIAESYRHAGADDFLALDTAARGERCAGEAARLCSALRRLLYSDLTRL